MEAKTLSMAQVNEEITVGELIELLEKCDPKATVVSSHFMGDGFEEVSAPVPIDLVRRTDQERGEYRRGLMHLPRYRKVTEGDEKQVVKCVEI